MYYKVIFTYTNIMFNEAFGFGIFRQFINPTENNLNKYYSKDFAW